MKIFLLACYTQIAYIIEMEFREFPEFTKLIDDILSEDEYFKFQLELAENPDKGKIIQKTGGARKVRIRVGRKGKSGGGRVIYYWRDAEDVIWLFRVYIKNDKSDLTEHEKAEIHAIIQDIKRGA